MSNRLAGIHNNTVYQINTVTVKQLISAINP